MPARQRCHFGTGNHLQQCRVERSNHLSFQPWLNITRVPGSRLERLLDGFALFIIKRLPQTPRQLRVIALLTLELFQKRSPLNDVRDFQRIVAP
ncbi:hypothetical protein D3C71_1665940 [compost metagenome]